MRNKKAKSKLQSHWSFNYFIVVLGSFIGAVGFVMFITPYKIIPGGLYGISIILHYLTKGVFSFAPEGLPIGTMAVIMDIPIAIIGYKVLGKQFVFRNLFGLLCTSFFIDSITLFWGYKPLVENDILLSALFGGILLGIGLGIIFKAKGATGGTDTIALIISKYTHRPVGRLLIIIDSIVVLIGVIAFQDWRIPLYSLIVIYIIGRLIDSIIQGIGYEKTVFIISDKYEEIRIKLLNDINRGGTYLMAEGMYLGKQRKVIYTVIDRRQLPILIGYIKEIDANAFVTVINANEVLGSGFKPIKEH